MDVRADVSNAHRLKEAGLQDLQLELVGAPGRLPGGAHVTARAADVSTEAPVRGREHGIELREEPLKDFLLGQTADLSSLVARHETDGYYVA